MTDWRVARKIELHLHLEGAAPPAVVQEIANEKCLDLEGILAPGGYSWSGFPDFLRTYEQVAAIFETAEDYARLMRAVLEKSADDGIVYSEIFLAPDFCGDASETAWREYLAAMTEAAAQARASSGIEARFIVTCIRHLGPRRAAQVAAMAAATAGGLVAGFGMGGDERHLSASEFARAFDLARAAGLGLTTHAGEICGPESIRDSISMLRPDRIGHGIRAIEDPDLVAELAERGTVLEVNPGSNVALGVVAEWRAHPIDMLRRQGVRVTVSTDDPPFFHTNLPREYRMLETTFGWGDAEFRAVNLVAAQAAFCDASTRRRLIDLFSEPEAP